MHLEINESIIDKICLFHTVTRWGVLQSQASYVAKFVWEQTSVKISRLLEGHPRPSGSQSLLEMFIIYTLRTNGIYEQWSNKQLCVKRWRPRYSSVIKCTSKRMPFSNAKSSFRHLKLKNFFDAEFFVAHKYLFVSGRLKSMCRPHQAIVATTKK